MSVTQIQEDQSNGLVPYEGATANIDLGTFNITTTGIITASSFVGLGGGGGSVLSVNGLTGAVVLDTDDISEGATNQYFTNERAQDAVGSILADSSSIDFTYTDATPEITAVVKPLGISASMLGGSIPASKLIGTDIDTVGTVASGKWQASVIAVAYGGTGLSTITANTILTGNGTSAVAPLALGAANRVLGMNTAGTANEYKALSVGTTGTDFNIASTAGALAFNLPTVASSVRGVLPASGSAVVSPTLTFENIPVLPGTDPTDANQATRKGYVDTIGAMVDPSLYKTACDLATTANITLSGEQTIDGTLTSASRVLVKNQTSSAENGIYTSSGGAWSRATDYNTAGEVVQGTSTFILGGSTNINRLYVMNSPSVTTLGTDPITFTPIGSTPSIDFSVGTSGSDFNVSDLGSNVTYNLPTATSSVRGALSAANWQTFNAKAGVSGATVSGDVATFNDTVGTVKDSGLNISGSSTSLTLANNNGDIYVRGKNSASGAAGIAQIKGGNGTGSTVDGANIVIEGGDFTSFPGIGRTAGNVVISGGSTDNAFPGLQASGGSVTIESGYNEQNVVTPAFLYLLAGNATDPYCELQMGGGPISIFPKTTINIHNTSDYIASLDPNNITTDRTYILPDGDGTFAVSASGGISISAEGDISLTGQIPASVLTAIETNVQIFTSDGTWTKPSGNPKQTTAILIGGGGGGGAGRRGAVGTIRTGGGGGGAGGFATMTFPTSILSSTISITVGQGGSGGATNTGTSANGAAGQSGTATFFGTWLRAGSGQGAGGGSTTSATGGNSGQLFPPGAASANNGAGSSSTGGSGTISLTNQFGPGGGGSGGGITSANTANVGGSGGNVGASSLNTSTSGYGTSINGGSGGATSTTGGNGNTSPSNSPVGGGGGGGGGGSTTTSAGAGGNGGTYGGGGGGGGAGTNGVGNGGAGGDGADGIAIIITTY